MREPKTLLGISVAFLRSCRCYLTLEGANALDACPEGLRLWEKKRWRKIEASVLFKRFKDVCPSCWASLCLDKLESSPYFLEIKPSDSYFTDIVQNYSLCTCDDNRPPLFGSKEVEKDVMEKFTLVMRAIIWHAPKYMKKCESEEVNGD